jgi:cytosine deaminase
MKLALELASTAKEEGDVPVGAVIVDPKTNSIISKCYNRSNIDKNPTLHAEIICIQEACKILDSKILKGYDLYVTLEPCGMCATAISFAQISRLYYGAYDKKFGAVENGPRIFNSTSSLFIPEIYGGILEEESAQLLKDFFIDRRYF